MDIPTERIEESEGQGGIVHAHESAQIEASAALAQRIGRSIKTFQNELEQWSCFTQGIAEECTFVLRKGGQRIIGPSIRFAELIMASYKHIVAETFIIGEEFGKIEVGAQARDLFRNTAVRASVKRNILKKDGKTRYNQDTIQSTVAAGQSIALRNAIIRLVPKALWFPIWLKSRDVAQGSSSADGKPVMPFSERVDRAFAFLASFGATADQVLAYLGKESKQDLDPDDVGDLQNKARALRAGEMDVDAAFPVPQADDKHGAAAAQSVGNKIKDGAKSFKDDVVPQAKAAAAKKRAARKKRATPKTKSPTPQEEADYTEELKAQEPAGADDVPDVDL